MHKKITDQNTLWWVPCKKRYDTIREALNTVSSKQGKGFLELLTLELEELENEVPDGESRICNGTAFKRQGLVYVVGRIRDRSEEESDCGQPEYQKEEFDIILMVKGSH